MKCYRYKQTKPTNLARTNALKCQHFHCCFFFVLWALWRNRYGVWRFQIRMYALYTCTTCIGTHTRMPEYVAATAHRITGELRNSPHNFAFVVSTQNALSLLPSFQKCICADNIFIQYEWLFYDEKKYDWKNNWVENWKKKIISATKTAVSQICPKSNPTIRQLNVKLAERYSLHSCLTAIRTKKKNIQQFLVYIFVCFLLHSVRFNQPISRHIDTNHRIFINMNQQHGIPPAMAMQQPSPQSQQPNQPPTAAQLPNAPAAAVNPAGAQGTATGQPSQPQAPQQSQEKIDNISKVKSLAIPLRESLATTLKVAANCLHHNNSTDNGTT